MANRKITDLPNSATLSGSESFILDQASLVDITGFNTVKTSLDDIRSYVTTGTPGLDIDGNVTIDGIVKLSGSLSARDDLEVQNLSAYNSLYVGEGGIDVTGGIDVALGDLDVQAGNQILSGGFDLFDIFGSGGAGAGTLLQVTLNGNETTEAACFGGTLSAQNFLASTDCNQNKPFETTNSILAGLDHCNYSENTTIVGGLSNVTSYGCNHTLGGAFNRNVGCFQNGSVVFGCRNRIGALTFDNESLMSAGNNNTIAGGYLNKICRGGVNQNNNFVGGGFNNEISFAATCGLSNPDGSSNAVVAGSGNKICCSVNGFIGTGYNHTMCNSNETFIGSGRGNETCTDTCYSAIVGGQSNLLCDTYGSVIGAGTENNIYSVCNAVVGGGRLNDVQPTGDGGAILGGNCNTVAACNSVIGGGQSNVVIGEVASIVGGQSNCAQGNYNFIGGGLCGITNSSSHQFIGTGFKNCSCALYASVINGLCNTNTSQYSTIITGSANQVFAAEYSIVAGKGNLVETASDNSFIGTGMDNTIKNSGSYNTILNGLQNCIEAGSLFNTILGGRDNVQSGSDFNLVWGCANSNCGGTYNVVLGYNNIIQAGGNSDGNMLLSYGSRICCGADFNAIIGGATAFVQPNVCCAIVLGMGSSFKATQSQTTYVCNLSVQGTPNFSTGFSGNIAGCSTITVTNGIITAAS